MRTVLSVVLAFALTACGLANCVFLINEVNEFQKRASYDSSPEILIKLTDDLQAEKRALVQMIQVNRAQKQMHDMLQLPFGAPGQLPQFAPPKPEVDSEINGNST
jgi:hypothetical protein